MADQSRVNARVEGRRVACVLFSRSIPYDEAAAFAEACFRFSPQISIRASGLAEAVFVEVGASRRLYSEAAILERLKVLAGRMLASKGAGVSIRVAIGDTAATALAAARYPEFARTRDLKGLPLSALTDFADPFCAMADPADIQKRVLRITCLLESLGIHDVGGFASLPRQSLASRLGKEAVKLMACVWGDLEAAWPGFHPLPSIVERDEVRDPEAHGLCADLEGCVFVLKGLVDRAMARLRGRCQRLSVLDVRLGVGVRRREWRVEFSLPQGSVAGVLPILREKLGYELQRVPLGGAVETVEIEVLESVPGAGTQKDFFSKKEEECEAWDGLVARLSARLGKDRVFVAFPTERYLPEGAFARKLVSVPVLSPAFDKKRAANEPYRPARVLKNPEPLAKNGRVLQTPGGQRWKVVSWEGPERLSGEWWKYERFEGFHRDYYRVVTEGGEQLWVFSSPTVSAKGSLASPLFFLHGYFD